MAGKVLDLRNVITPDSQGVEIARFWMEWNLYRQPRMTEWTEVRKYIFATDTTTTTNSKLPWKNKTTVPKLCQIRDNLNANYMSAIFPKRKWLIWEGCDKESEEKRQVIQDYMANAISQETFKKEVTKLILDYIDYGNAFAMSDWEDNTQELVDKTKVGYVGPTLKRISPVDIVFNPIAESFEKSPKIVRSLVSMGEVKEYLERLSTDDNREAYENLYKYLKGNRTAYSSGTGFTDIVVKDEYLRVDGFTDYQRYLDSNICELLTFYGDIYNSETDEFKRNQIIVVADRHKILSQQDNPSVFGTSSIHQVGWRIRQDNLWAMGPLDNLVGMQYRLDHVENIKADVFDLLAFPVLKIKGQVEDFTWAPFERIYIGDDQSDVTIVAPPFQMLQANSEIDYLQKQMEEMAGAPKEAMGMRTPGEKTAYEVQKLENGASRVFNAKIIQMEEFLERLLNDMLELGRRKGGSSLIRVFNDKYKIVEFKELTAEDISGVGNIRPVSARHFAERAELIQNLNNFSSSPLGQDPEVKTHFSTIKVARMIETLLEMEDYELVTPFIRMAEQADAKRLAQAAQQQVMMEALTPSGMSHDDYDEDAGMPGGPTGMPPQMPQAAPPDPMSLFSGSGAPVQPPGPPQANVGAPGATPAASPASLFGG